MAPSPSDDLQRSKTRNCLLILAWVDSRSRQLIVATRRKLSRPRFLGHEIRAGARKGKKKSKEIVTTRPWIFVSPGWYPTFGKNWSIDGRRPSAEKKKLDGHWAPFRLFIWPSKGIFETDPAFREILPPVPRRPLVRCRRNDSMAFLFKIFVLRWTTVGRIFIDETVNRWSIINEKFGNDKK